MQLKQFIARIARGAGIAVLTLGAGCRTMPAVVATNMGSASTPGPEALTPAPTLFPMRAHKPICIALDDLIVVATQVRYIEEEAVQLSIGKLSGPYMSSGRFFFMRQNGTQTLMLLLESFIGTMAVRVEFDEASKRLVVGARQGNCSLEDVANNRLTSSYWEGADEAPLLGAGTLYSPYSIDGLRWPVRPEEKR